MIEPEATQVPIYFAIVCMGRTGSTLLADLLNSHPDIECRGELFGLEFGYKDYPNISRREFLEQYAYETEKPIRGFKMPLDWILRGHFGIFDDFRELGYKIVRLNRANILAHWLSIRLAQVNSNWGSKHIYENQHVRIEPWQFLSFIGRRNAWNQLLDALCEGTNPALFEYERLFETAEQARLLTFLGANVASLSTSKIRQRTAPLSDAIENYDELSAALTTTPFSTLAKPRG